MSVVDDKVVADMTWGAEAASPLPEAMVGSETAAVSASLPVAAGISSPNRRPRRGMLGWALLFVLVAAAAGVAAYQLVLAPKPPAAPAPAITGIAFVVEPADAMVEIGGKEVGRHSPFEVRLGPGVYSIRVRREGYRPWTTEVMLRDGDRPTVQVALEAGMAHLSLSSLPPGLVAQLDGIQLEQVTPIERKIPSGQHTLVVTNAAGVTWTKNFTAEINGTYSYVAPLNETPPADARPPLVAPTAVTKLTGEVPVLKASGITESATDAIAKLCIDERGRVTSVKIVKALPDISDELERNLGTWRYKPYAGPTGVASPACFPLTFRVALKRAK